MSSLHQIGHTHKINKNRHIILVFARYASFNLDFQSIGSVLISVMFIIKKYFVPLWPSIFFVWIVMFFFFFLLSFEHRCSTIHNRQIINKWKNITKFCVKKEKEEKKLATNNKSTFIKLNGIVVRLALGQNSIKFSDPERRTTNHIQFRQNSRSVGYSSPYQFVKFIFFNHFPCSFVVLAENKCVCVCIFLFYFCVFIFLLNFFTLFFSLMWNIKS